LLNICLISSKSFGSHTTVRPIRRVTALTPTDLPDGLIFRIRVKPRDEK
jgi:hypothetical protein